ncbi:MAG: NADPH dehydrogenase NamA [Aminivibrio sp.]
MKTYEPFKIKDLELKNRIVMPPMCMYSAPDSKPGDFHLQHYGARALGGAGLIIVEATGVLPEGRISDNCLGLWSDEQVAPMARLVDHVRGLGAKIGIQLNHAGRKCGAKAEKLYAPSAVNYSSDGTYPDPAEMTDEDIARVTEAFRTAAGRARAAGFDVLEVHGAHGYLVDQFLSPLSNLRRDGYGAIFEGRARFLQEVLQAVRTEWPAEKPLFLRVSAEDYVSGGMTPADMVHIINRVTSMADVIHVSSGGVTPVPPPVYPGYQIPFAETIKRECSVPTIAVGLISSLDMVEETLHNNRADLVALGRELLRNPFFPLLEAWKRRVALPWPEQYERAFR